MDKRADSLPLNTIVIAVIVLVVLVVIIIIFGGGAGKFAGGVKNCVSSGGECKDLGSFKSCQGLVPEAGQTGEYNPGAIVSTLSNTDCDDRAGTWRCCKLIYEGTRP